MLKRFAVMPLLVACGGTAPPTDAGLEAGGCHVPSACTSPAVQGNVVPLDSLVSQGAFVGVASTDCGYELLTLAGGVLLASQLDVAGGQIIVAAPQARGANVDMVVGNRDHDLLFISSGAGQYVFSGPAVMTNTVSTKVSASDYGVAGAALHGDRVMVLFTSNTDPGPFWFEMARDGTVTQPLQRVHAPIGDARFDGFGGEQLTEYSAGFAWIEPSNTGQSIVVFSKGPGLYETQPISVVSPERSPIVAWPYVDGAVAIFAHPSLAIRDDGTQLTPINESMPPTPYPDTQWHHHVASAELGLVSAARGAFNVINANGSTSAQGSYDGGIELQVFIQPAPSVAVFGGQAVFANADGNVVSMGCGAP